MSESNAPWDQAILACGYTWFMLTAMDELEEDFAHSKDVKMEKLNFWNSVASDEGRKLIAKSRAAELDNFYRYRLLAEYEIKDAEGNDLKMNFNKAIDLITDILTDKDKTVAELAHTIDGIYKFRRE